MAIEQISTGYRPEFALGALYHGYNAGNADNAAQLANLTSQWDLQRKQAQDPLNTISKEYDAKLANAKMQSPGYIPWMLQGYIGQMKSQDAAGRMKQAIYDDELAATTNELRAKSSAGILKQEELNHYLERIAELKRRRDAGALNTDGASGFEMQQQEQQSNYNPNYGNEGRGLTPLPILKTEAAMKASMGNDYRSGSKPYDLETIDKEIKLHGDPKGILAAERARIVAELSKGGAGEQPNAGIPGPAPVFSNMSSSTTGGTNKWAQGIPGSNPYHEGMMGILMDTPEFRQRMAQVEHKTDAQLEQQQLRQEMLRDMQAAKKTINEPKYKEQLAAAIQILSTANADPAAKAKAQMFYNYHQQLVTAAAPANWKQTPDMTQFGIQTNPSPVQQTQATTQAPAAASDGMEAKVTGAGFKYEPTLYDYRVGPDGKVQRKKKE